MLTSIHDDRLQLNIPQKMGKIMPTFAPIQDYVGSLSCMLNSIFSGEHFRKVDIIINYLSINTHQTILLVPNPVSHPCPRTRHAEACNREKGSPLSHLSSGR